MGNARPQNLRAEALRERFEAHRQGHVFQFWDRLDDPARDRLAAQAAAIDLERLLSARAAATSASKAPRDLAPALVERAAGAGGDPGRISAARDRGEAMLSEGRVAVLVVAGGQATRLGIDGPKGAFPIGPVSERSLFELQAQKIRRLRRRFGRPVPWYVLTSPATAAATESLFVRAEFFGLPAADVFFVEQSTVPAFDFEGRLVLERPDRIFENPDGHGGSLPALLTSGAVDDMERRGIDTLFYYQVDNPLVRIADPAYVGFHDLAGADMSCKVTRKLDPKEKVGIVARVGGRFAVVEYTELDDETRFARDANGELLHWAGSIAMHVFSTAFIRRVGGESDVVLPFHASPKTIPYANREGVTVKPPEPNGVKLERFVFDALAAADKVCVVEAVREDEYSPVKNARGADSPETARRALVRCYREWLDAAGIEVPSSVDVLEIDHSRVDGPEDAAALGIRHVSEAGDTIRTSTGVGA